MPDKMTIDYITLRKRVGGVFINNKDFEEAIEKSHSFTNRLLNGRLVDSLNLKTIYKIKEVLNLTDAEILSIFFCTKIEN